MPRRPPSTLLLCLLLAVLYVATGVLGLSLASFGDRVTLLWAPAGLSLGALVVGGRRLWPGVWLGALLVNLWTGAPWWVALGISIGNTLEGVVGATLLRQTSFAPALERVGDVGRFLLVAVLGAPAVAATFGTATLVLSGGAAAAEAPMVWLLWWLGDGTGALVVAPVLLTWVHAKRPSLEALGLTAILAGTLALAFGTTGPHVQPLSIAPFILVFAASMRHGVPLTSALVALAAGAAVLGAFANTGPFVQAGGPDLGQTWAYVLLLGCSMQVVAALVSERRAADQERQQMQADALEAQHLEGLGLIAAGIGHDFNNLLQVIQGHSALARAGIEGSHLEQIDAAVAEAAQLCDQLLAYAGKSHLLVEPVSLPSEISAIRRLVDASIPAGVRLEVHDGDNATVNVDRVQLHRAVLNLLRNAAEASIEGRGRIQVRYGRSDLRPADLEGCAVVGASAQPGSFGWLEVEDDGSGMRADVQDKLFEPFFTTRFQGRGLGMASVAGIARAHHGAIEVDSQVGRGTRVRVYLPWSDAQPATEPPTAPTSPAPPPCADGTIRVLLVDDDDTVRAVATMVLERSGYDVVAAASGEEALRCCEDPAIRVAVLDYTMPDMNGAETAARLRILRPGLPIVMCSGLGPDRARGDADVFVQKPYGPSELQGAIERVLPAT